MTSLEKLKQQKTKLLNEAEAKKSKLNAKIAQVKGMIEKAERAKTQTAKSHLKNVFGGWCLAMMEDASASPDFKQILLMSTDDDVTQNQNNLARKMFDAYKQKWGL